MNFWNYSIWEREREQPWATSACRQHLLNWHIDTTTATVSSFTHSETLLACVCIVSLSRQYSHKRSSSDKRRKKKQLCVFDIVHSFFDQFHSGKYKMSLPTEDVVLYSIIAFIVVENCIEIYLSLRQVRI